MTKSANELFHAAAGALLSRAIGPKVPSIQYGSAEKAHVAYMEQISRLNGLTPERYPALFKSFQVAPKIGCTAAAGDPVGTYKDGQVIDYLSALKDSGLASAHAIVTRVRSAVNMFVTLTVINRTGKTETILAEGIARGFNKQTVEVFTNNATANPLPSTGENFAILKWTVRYTHTSNSQVESGELIEKFSIHSDGSPVLKEQQAGDPVISDPAVKRDHPVVNPDKIVIGLARSHPEVDIDYWFYQTQWDQFTLLVPFKGSIKFQQYVKNPLVPEDIDLHFYLARSEGGMTNLPLNDINVMKSRFTAVDDTLFFDFSADATTAGNAINFGNPGWQSDTTTYFTADVRVKLEDDSWGSFVVMSSTAPDTDPADGILHIKPIMYVWHCLAAGSKITLADGTTKAVEDFRQGMEVKSGNGTTKVRATLAQPHTGTVYVVTTRGGASLTCSGTHPVMTPDGPMQASSLVKGSMIRTLNGTDTVTEVEMREMKHEGLFNLLLDCPRNQASFYANGFLVGDYQVQVELPRDPDVIRKHLPDDLLLDFEHYLEDMKIGKAEVRV